MVGYGQPLQVREVPVPEPRGDAVLVKIAGSGLCHSDLHLMDGAIPIVPSFPWTLGHENAGWVQSIGEGVRGFSPGDPVVVYGGWSTQPDRFTWLGLEQLSDVTRWVGIGQPGGYAEYLLVPTSRYLLHLDGLHPVEAAPLVDAGLTPYRAVKKLVPSLYPGATIALIGIGGLGQYGVQYARALAPSSRIIAVDVSDEKLALAQALGADVMINSREEDVVRQVKMSTDGEGAQGIIDFYGSDQTLADSAGIAGRQATVVVVGLAGGTLPFGAGLLNEAVFTTSSWGTQAELGEVLTLARQGVTASRIQEVRFEQMNDVFAQLRQGQIDGRAVLVPSA